MTTPSATEMVADPNQIVKHLRILVPHFSLPLMEVILR